MEMYLHLPDYYDIKKSNNSNGSTFLKLRFSVKSANAI